MSASFTPYQHSFRREESSEDVPCLVQLVEPVEGVADTMRMVVTAVCEGLVVQEPCWMQSADGWSWATPVLIEPAPEGKKLIVFSVGAPQR